MPLATALFGLQIAHCRHDFVGRRRLTLPENQPEQCAVDQNQHDFQIEQCLDDDVRRLLRKYEKETFKGRECGLGQRKYRLHGRKQRHQYQVYARKKQGRVLHV